MKLAVAKILPRQPDLVVSGMNMGANVGINVIYSGTVAAAIEAAFLGLPSIAVSLYLRTDVPADYPAGGRVRDAGGRAGLGGRPVGRAVRQHQRPADRGRGSRRRA